MSQRINLKFPDAIMWALTHQAQTGGNGSDVAAARGVKIRNATRTALLRDYRADLLDTTDEDFARMTEDQRRELAGL